MKKLIKRGSILSLALLLSISAVNPSWSVTQYDEDMVVLNPGGGVLPDGSDGIRIHFNDFKSNLQRGSDQIYFANQTYYVGGGVGATLAVGSDVRANSGVHSEIGRDADDMQIFNLFSRSGLTGQFQRVPAGTTDASVTYSAAKGDAGVTFTYSMNSGGVNAYLVKRKITYTSPNKFFDEEWTVTIPQGHPAGTEVKLYFGGNNGPGGSDTGTGLLREANGLKTIYSSSPDSGKFISYSEVDSFSTWTRYFSGAQGTHSEVIPGQAGNNDIETLITAATHNTELHVQWNIGSAPGDFVKRMRTTVGLNSEIPAAPAAPLDIRPLDLDLALDASIGAVVPGGPVRLRGGGLIANSPLGLVLRSTPVTINLNGRTADAAGNFDFLATLPASIAAGVHSLTLTGTKPDGNPISDVLYFEIDTAGKLLWSQASTPRPALARTGPDFWSTAGLLLPALALIGFGAARIASRRTKKA